MSDRPARPRLPAVLAARSARGAAMAAAGLTALIGALASAPAVGRPYGPGTGSAAAHMASTAAMSCETRSPAHTVALLELFTSEGCSSCPPADRWLGSLAGKGYGSDKVVPLAWHVGYWDSLGWKDPYAQARFAERQRDYARQRRYTTIFTPQLIAAGHDLRPWGDPELSRLTTTLATRPAAARIVLDGSAVGSAVRVRAEAQLSAAPREPSPPGTGAQLHWVVFESGLKNPVLRGENSGATLGHEAVVRHWQGPVPFAQGKAALSQVVPLAEPAGRRTLGVAAFVQDERGDILQATACTMQ